MTPNDESSATQRRVDDEPAEAGLESDSGADAAPESQRVVPLHSAHTRRQRSVPPPPTRSTRTFSQKRARDTYKALIDAAQDTFSEKGFDAAQTTDIALAAGVSVGTFYRYFADKRQAFIEMITAHLDDAYEQILARLDAESFSVARSEADRHKAVDVVLDVLFRHAGLHPDLHRVFLGMSLRDVDVARIRVEYESRGREGIALLIEQVVPRRRVPDAVAAAEVIQIAAQEVAIFTVGGRGTHKTPEQAVALRAALGDMIFRYLFSEANVSSDK